MHPIRLEGETDFDGWRKAARFLVLNNMPPDDVTWHVQNPEPELFTPSDLPLPKTPHRTFNVPAKFIEQAESVILHRDPERFARLYRVLWRLRSHPELMSIATDPDVAILQDMTRGVHRDQHKMKAFVRFREIGQEPKSRFVAWFEPGHHIVEATAPFFARRFADMDWSILTPDVSAHWDGQAVSITSGVVKSDAPHEDRLEETWLTYYANIFNPARLKTKAMQTEMPKKYWRNLPEAALIRPLIATAERMTSEMITADATTPRKLQRREQPMTTPSYYHDSDSINALKDEARECRACPLWKDATQTVFGEGPQGASVMMVGEQPGDKEDLAAKPFVGPAGQMLDRALKEAGIDRTKVYVTNAVKHFKFVPRGKFRLHQKPNTSEIRACRPWYERELASVKPELVVAMGATAAQSVLGQVTPINKIRGRVIMLDDTTRVLVTVHPSYLLRLPDENARVREYQRFVDDLRIVAAHLGASARAA